MLLMVIKGLTSFKDLRTMDGVLCELFHEACLKQGLLQDDGEWRLCLQDAAEIQTGSQLWHLFAILLLFCAPATPKDLWLEFRTKICDDLCHCLHKLGCTSVTDNEVYDFGLHLINDILGDSGHTLLDFSQHGAADLQLVQHCQQLLDITAIKLRSPGRT